MITITKRPEQFSPSGNLIIYQVESDNQNIKGFNVQVIDADSSAVIENLKLTPTPADPRSAFVNLSKVLQSTVNWEINNNSSLFVVAMQKTVRSFKLIFSERILAGSSIVDGDSLTGSTAYVFNGEVGRITAEKYLSVQYVVSSTGSIKFLTNQPNFKKTNNISPEFLYFLQDGSVAGLAARIRLYNSAGGLLTTVQETLTDIDTYQMYRLNVSPKALHASKGLTFGGVAYYVIDLVDGSGNEKSEERVYHYEPTVCHSDYVNLLWVNAWGGIDSYQWIAPQDSISTSRFILKTNTATVDDNGVYSDINGGVYNPSDVIINNKVATKTSVWSKDLTDDESYWLKEIFSTKQLFVELTDLSLATALLNETNYTIPRKRYIRNQPNTINVSFTLSDGILPSGVHAYSTTTASLEFINTQMNALQVDLPGYAVTMSGATEYSPIDYDTINDYS